MACLCTQYAKTYGIDNGSVRSHKFTNPIILWGKAPHFQDLLQDVANNVVLGERESKIVPQRKSLRWGHSAWEPVDDQSKRQLQQLGLSGAVEGNNTAFLHTNNPDSAHPFAPTDGPNWLCLRTSSIQAVCESLNIQPNNESKGLICKRKGEGVFAPMFSGERTAPHRTGPLFSLLFPLQ
jgi:hypothetical protein